MRTRGEVLSVNRTKLTIAPKKMNMLCFSSMRICWSKVALGQRFKRNLSSHMTISFVLPFRIYNLIIPLLCLESNTIQKRKIDDKIHIETLAQKYNVAT